MNWQIIPGKRGLSLIRTPAWHHIPSILLLLIALFILDAIFQPTILSMNQIGLQLGILIPGILISLGQNVVVLSGGIDLSVGGIMVVTNVLCATMLGASGTHLWMLIIIVLLGVILGVINGLLITLAGFEPFIATLGTWAGYNGIALTILNTDGGSIPGSLPDIVNGYVGPVNDSFLIFFVILLALYWFHHSVLNLHIRAVGGDGESAERNGINTSVVRIMAYGVCGLLCTLAGIYLAAETTTGTPTAGNGYILSSIVAVAIGGTRLSGGKGNLFLTVAGVAILQIIANLVFALSLQPFVAIIISNALLLGVVSIQSIKLDFRRETL
ncbi:MAG: ABC transporter permease [Bacilli bacterium]